MPDAVRNHNLITKDAIVAVVSNSVKTGAMLEVLYDDVTVGFPVHHHGHGESGMHLLCQVCIKAWRMHSPLHLPMW